VRTHGNLWSPHLARARRTSIDVSVTLARNWGPRMSRERQKWERRCSLRSRLCWDLVNAVYASIDASACVREAFVHAFVPDTSRTMLTRQTTRQHAFARSSFMIPCWKPRERRQRTFARCVASESVDVERNRHVPWPVGGRTTLPAISIVISSSCRCVWSLSCLLG
jgi:hypothetical protein